ncbi:hypothetical protein LTR70_003542 [Exophiala xenobiotica]|uniref:Uncharacterized protein n=1 Tax=Lithohypha guttulata TaxID=1690604 RepID=A0ABR0KFX9_9EURO|nr:hypothetical protein LTR24_003090 [Lithohypha guttulata]KAK5322921.1 hypothetical protein LTR70_003542 [Exophiala xenobiotica]
MTTPTRRSRRERKPNTRYDDQVAWTEALPMLRAESDSPDSSSDSATPEAIERQKDPDIGDVVMHDVEDPELEQVQEDGDFSDAAASSSVGTPDEDGPVRNASLPRLAATSSSRKQKVVPRPRTKALAAEQGLRNRMLDEGEGRKQRASKDKVYTYNFGSQLDDLYPIIRSRDIWHLNPRDVLLPSRSSMVEALKLEATGRYLQQPQTAGAESQERGNRSSEEDHSEREVVQTFQQIQPLGQEDAARQMFWDDAVSNAVVIGPQYEARKHRLEPLQPLDVAKAVQERDGVSSSYRNGVFSVLSPPRKPKKRSQPSHEGKSFSHEMPATTEAARQASTNVQHQGWIVNLGARPQCLAWAPAASDAQYLAVSFRCSKAQRDAASPKPTKLAPAFSPSPDYPSHIQIWRIMALPVFSCFALPSHEDLIAGGADGAVSLYNLHSHSSDGELQPYATISIHNTYIMNIAVASDLPHFLASTSANGEMVLTDLRAPHQDRVRVHKSRLPTRNLSYLPHTRTFLSTSDASGNSEAHGTSLSIVVAHNLRHFYHSNTIMKLPEASGIATVLASSTFHPIILAANAAGSVFVSNVLRRLLPTILKDERGGGFMMKLCEVAWIPVQQETSTKEAESASEDTNAQHSQTGDASGSTSEKPTHRFVTDPMEVPPKPEPEIDLFHGPDTRSGIARIHEFFQPERIELLTFGQDHTGKKSKTKNKDERRAENVPSAASYQIICHEEQAVTAMAWNGNGRCAGWAAIAWGSGLLRIQDLAHGD